MFLPAFSDDPTAKLILGDGDRPYDLDFLVAETQGLTDPGDEMVRTHEYDSQKSWAPAFISR